MKIIWEYANFFNSDMLWSVKSIRDSTSYISSFLIVIRLSFKIWTKNRKPVFLRSLISLYVIYVESYKINRLSLDSKRNSHFLQNPSGSSISVKGLKFKWLAKTPPPPPFHLPKVKRMCRLFWAYVVRRDNHQKFLNPSCLNQEHLVHLFLETPRHPC